MQKLKISMYSFLLLSLIFYSVGIAFAEQDNVSDYQNVSENFSNKVGEQLEPQDNGEAKDETRSVKIKKKWLSAIQFSTDKSTKIRAGDEVCGNYVTAIKGHHGATLIRTYSIEDYNHTIQFGPSTYWQEGDVHFSWCFGIPFNQATGKDRPQFFHTTYIQELNRTITVKKQFNVLRDGYVNANRAYMPTMNSELKKQIKRNCKDVATTLQKCDLKYTKKSKNNSKNAARFLLDLTKYKPAAALIHSHGSSTDGGRIYLKDDSFVNATSLAASGLVVPGGLFYSAVCEGAASPTLGNAFVARGYDAYIGYTVSVFTTRNADFYKYFFNAATMKDISVNTAIGAARAWANGQGWTDVATAVVIGDGSDLYLGGETPDKFDRKGESGLMSESKPAVALRYWTDVTTIDLSTLERKAVEKALEIAEFNEITDGNTSKMTTGIEEFQNSLRVAFKDGDRFVYGVDFDKSTGEIIEEGELD